MNFVRSSVDKVESFEMVVDCGGGNKKIRMVDSTEPNPPINLDHISIFYPDGSSETYYNIYFSLAYDTSTVHIWYYSPTKEGKEQRDADLEYLHTLCQQIPQNIPSAQR